MGLNRTFSPHGLRSGLRRLLVGPQALAFLPALALGAFWFGGEGALIVVALGTPLLVLGAGMIGAPRRTGRGPRDAVTGLLLGDALETAIDDALEVASSANLKSACLLVEIED